MTKNTVVADEKTIDDDGTTTINRDTTVKFSGAASCRIDIDASNNGYYIQQSNLSAGKYYRADFVAKTNNGAGGPHLRLDSYGSFALTGSWATYSQDFIATCTDFRLRFHQAASRSIWIGYVQVIELAQTAVDDTANRNDGSLVNGPLWTKSDSPLNDRRPHSSPD